MKRIISFVLCLSMLISMVPMHVFAADVENTTPVTEAVLETEAPAVTEAPAAETTAAEEPETTGAAAEETAAPTEAPEVTEAATEEATEAVTEEVTEPASTETEETVEEDTYVEFTWIPDEELPSDEELFAGYVDKILYGASTYGIMAGSRLTGDAKTLYDGLRPIIEQAAAGTLSKVEIAITEVAAGPFADLDELRADLGSTASKTFYALLADMPYELYWFDKTKGVIPGCSYIENADGSISCTKMTMRFCVSPDYCPADANWNYNSETGAKWTYDLDTAKTGAAAAAAANARDIVDTYAGSSDYEKLVAYRDEICALTAYNSSAASSGYTGGYGNPWQLIWVFDGDASTKVVCEGYSKAFQYLCDLTDFEADITCYNVQGTMSGGGHMWNIVSINGSSYLVDVTNSEVGTIGYKDKLFLVGKTPNSDGSYTLAGAKFVYDSTAIAQWGTGAGSILTLAESNFDPATLEVAPMTGEELQAALNAATMNYWLERDVEITSDVVIPKNKYMNANGYVNITVKAGGSLTISDKASLSVANCAGLIVEEGGSLVNNGTFAVGGGTVCTVAGTLENNGIIDVYFGRLDITGTYTPGENANVQKDTVGIINGIDTEQISLYTYVYDEDTLSEALVPTDGYATTMVYLMCMDSNNDGIADGSLEFTKDVTVPEGVKLYLGNFNQNDQFILSDGVKLTNNGDLLIMSDAALTINEGGRLVNNGYFCNFGTITNNGVMKGDGEVQQSGTLNGSDFITGDAAALDDFLESVAAAEASGENLAVWGEITLAEDLTINMSGELSFADYAKLVVPDGVTLTVNGPIAFNHSELVVEEGGKLISNTKLSVSDYNDISGVATIDGELISNGEIWITDGAILNINGSAEVYQNTHVGFGGNGTTCELNVNGSMVTYAYLNIVESTGALNVAEDAVLTIGGVLVDDAGEPYTNGYLQACGTITVDGTMNVSGGVTLDGASAASMDITSTGKLNINQDCMWFDVGENGILTNEGTVQNHTIIHNYGTILNYGTFHNNVQIRLFGTGTYDTENGTHYGNAAIDGATAQLNDFLADLEDGQGANLYDTVTLTENLTIGLGEDQVVLHGGSELHIPDGVTLTINSPVIVNEAALVVEDGGTLIINTNVPVTSGGALGCIIVYGQMTINDGGTLWLDNGGTLEVYDNGVVDVLDDPATQGVSAAIHVADLSDSATVLVEGTMNTSGYVNVTPGGCFTLRESGTLNILNTEENGCGYLDVTGMAQLYGTVNQDGLMSASNGNGTADFVPNTARIEVYGPLNGSDTSVITINPNASISVAPSGVLTTAGEVNVEQFGTLWVDGDVTFSGPAPVTSYGNIHVNHFLDDADYNGCLIIDGTVTNYGYMNIGQSGTLYVNGTLNISQTVVEDQGFAGYLNSFGYVIVNGTVNNSALMDTDSPDGFGSLKINAGGTVNVRDNIVMAVCDLGSLIIDGTLNIFSGANMEIYNEVSGTGTWINNGTVHFGVYTMGEPGEETVGCSSFSGTYTQNSKAVLEVTLYEGEPIYVDLVPAGMQTLVYVGGDMDAIRAVLANAVYRTHVVITEETAIDADLVIGTKGKMTIHSGVTIPETVTVTAYGPIVVEELDEDGTTAALTVDGELKLYHPRGTMTILENALVTVNGMVNNGTSATVHGSLVINGRWVGYAPYCVEGGTITGEGAPSEYEMFLTLIREAGAGGYPVVVDENLTLPADSPWHCFIGCDLIVAEGATLTMNRHVDVGGSLTVEQGAKLVNNAALRRLDEGRISVNGAYRGNGDVINLCADPETYIAIDGISKSKQTLSFSSCNSGEALVTALALAEGYDSAEVTVHGAITLTDDLLVPDNTAVLLECDYTEDGEQIPGHVTVPAEVTVTNEGSVRVGYDCTLTIHGSWYGNVPEADEYGGTIEGDYTRLAIGTQYKDQPGFFENAATSEQAPGLWAGGKTSFYPTLFRVIGGERLDASAVRVSFSEGAENYAKIVQKDGLITITANADLAAHQIITITLTADGAEPCSVDLHLRPKASAANVLLDGKVVSGQTILADLNRGDTGFQLTTAGAPADAVPENGVLAGGGELVTWKSSAPAVATVDDNGCVTVTGTKTGKVKITMTANYGVKKTAVVTFNVVALPQEILSAAANPTVLVGGSGASYSATDAEGNVLKSTAVKWYLSDKNGQAISAHPYAAITAAGKLTTKTVADETKVYLMAQVIGDEQSAALETPVCVTVYPAIDTVQILAEGMDITGQTLPYDVGATGLTTKLDWAAGPYVESIQSVSWKSSKASVADIDEDGLITVASEDASGAVKFTLTVTARNGKKTTAVVTLNFGIFTTGFDMAVTLPDGRRTDDLNGLSVYGGETLTFEASCLPETVTTKGVTWSLDSKTYGSISSKGVLKTKVVSNPTVITVIVQSKDGFGYAIPVELMPKKVSTGDGLADALYVFTDGMEEEFKYLTKTTHSIKSGDTMQLYANDAVTWKSSNTVVADVAPDGTLEALANGSATITATAADGRTAAFTLKVTKMSVNVDIITKKGALFLVYSGKSLDLEGIVTFSDGSTDKKVTWSVNDTSVATINNGKLAAAKGLKHAQTVRVYADAKDGNSWNFVDVQVLPMTTAIEIFGPSGEDITNTTITWDMLTGTTFALDAATYPVDALDAVDWKSSSNKIATVDEEGNVECLTSGTVTITATAKDGSGKKATFKLTVKKTMEYLQLPESAIVGGGKSLTFSKLEGYHVDPLATNQNLSWIMTYPDGSPVPASVATIAKGVLKTKAVTAPVTLFIRAEATDGSGLADDCTVTIFPVMKGVELYNTEGAIVSKKTVTTPVNEGYTILPDATNVKGFGYDDDGTADESLSPDEAWTITYSKSGIVEAAFDGQAITFYAVGTPVGHSVKITLKANDGSGKSAYFTLSFTKASQPQENVELSVIAAEYGNQTADWWADFVREFNETYPHISFEVEVVSWNVIYDVINARIESGDTPDILNIDMFAGFQADGLLLPAREYISPKTYAKFYPAFLEQSEIDGTVWAVPDLAAARALYYNADVLAEAGVKVPATWAELTAVCETLKETYPDMIPFAADMTDNDSQATFINFARNNGGGFVDENGNWALNSAENVEAVEFLVDMVDKGLTNSVSLAQTRYELQEMFANGQIAMMIGPDQIGTCCDIYGQINYGISSIPANVGDSVSLAVMDRMMCFDNDYTDAELAAVTTFFDFFYEDERYAQWVMMEDFLPATSTGCEAMTEMDPRQAVWTEILGSAEFYPAEKAEWADVKNGVIKVLKEALQGADVQALLDELQARVS